MHTSFNEKRFEFGAYKYEWYGMKLVANLSPFLSRSQTVGTLTANLLNVKYYHYDDFDVSSIEQM